MAFAGLRDTIRAFASAEHGAVTVDFVVLTGALVSLGLLVITIVVDGVMDTTTGIEAYLLTVEVNDGTAD